MQAKPCTQGGKPWESLLAGRRPKSRPGILLGRVIDLDMATGPFRHRSSLWIFCEMTIHSCMVCEKDVPNDTGDGRYKCPGP